MTRILTIAGLLVSSMPAFAGWNTVFTATCCDRPRIAQRPSAKCDTCAPAPAPIVAQSPCDTCAPRTSAKVEYERTCYTVPVTVLRPERYVEEVATQVKSYYWEPVTSYTYRSYYDPCSQECQQIQIPRTSYVRKEECNTVMKAVERMRMVPVQVERQVCESRPVITSYGPVTKTYGPLTPAGGAVPRVEQQRQPNVYQDGDRIPPTGVPSTPGGTSNPKPNPNVPQAMPSTANFRSNALTTSMTRETDGKLAGEVVKQDKTTPVANAKLVFVNAGNTEQREYATADAFGSFEKKLSAGEWYLYVGPGDGKASYHSKVTVKEGGTRSVTVASR
jgi:hypothetical protein